LPIDGVVKGEIHVSPVVISGSVLGPVIADDSLKLEVGAWVKGRVSYASMEIHFGAVVESRLLHNTDPIARRVDLKLALSKSAGWVIQPCLRKPVFSEFFVFIS
jgi:cytoskeletal protein CcmA (bactofilin family)